MAILKHVPSHNANYSDVIDYLTKKHDEETNKPLLDEHGQMVEREEYLIEGINCTPEDFAEKCIADSIRFKANRSKSDVTTHQYIWSFDPKDKEKGLTLEEALAAGVDFAKRNFPGHRCIVCAHPDGSNGSENTHVHVVLCSVRFKDHAPNDEYMRLNKDGSIKKSSYKAGCKHVDTARLRKYLYTQIQEYCRTNGYTVLETNPPKKVTSQERKVKAKGQVQLDKDNEARRAQGLSPVQKEFKTKKDDLRAAIDFVASKATNWDEFATMLRTCLTRQVEFSPQKVVIPYQERQDLWTLYKQFNSEFWSHHKEMYEIYKKDISADYDALRARNELEFKSKNKKNSFLIRISASRKLKKSTSKEAIKNRISINQESQDKLILFKNIYQTYKNAAKIALTNNMKEEAILCLSYMEDLRKLQEGYWTEGQIGNSTHLDLTDINNPRSYINWKNVYETDLVTAQDILEQIQQQAHELKKRESQTELREEPFSIDVKISRGVISFKHPDLERWTRGKSLGSQYEVKALATAIAKNKRRELNKNQLETTTEKTVTQIQNTNIRFINTSEYER